MRPQWIALAAVLFFILNEVSAQTPEPVSVDTNRVAQLQPLTLAETLALAEQFNPVLRAKQAQLAAAEGAQAGAGALLNSNPQVILDRTRREVPSQTVGLTAERYREWNAGLSQTLEIAGQQSHRRDATDAVTRALRAEIAATRQQVRAEVTNQFYRVLAWQQRSDLESRAVKLFETSAAAIEKRRAAGEDTRLDANVAHVEAERARNQFAITQEQLLDARAELAAKLQLPSDGLPLAIGDLGMRASLYRLADLVNRAVAQPRLRALNERENSADARLKLERASRYPDITLGVNVGREGASGSRERLTTFSVSVPLPFFQRNQAAIGQALTELAQAQIERQATQRDVAASVNHLWAKLSSLRDRVERLQESVLIRLDDNEALSMKSQRAGQIGLIEMMVVNRQALDARRALIDALLDYQTTRVALEYAAGWSPEGE